MHEAPGGYPDGKKGELRPSSSASSAFPVSGSTAVRLGLDLLRPDGHAHATTEDHHEVWSRQSLDNGGFALVLVLGVAATPDAQQAPAGAQGGGGRGGGAPFTPAAGAKDLRSVLFNWMWHQGMLKGADERDMVAMLE